MKKGNNPQGLPHKMHSTVRKVKAITPITICEWTHMLSDDKKHLQIRKNASSVDTTTSFVFCFFSLPEKFLPWACLRPGLWTVNFISLRVEK